MDTWAELRDQIKEEIATKHGLMTELAEYLGRSRQHVNSYINGDKTPNYDHAMEMRKWLESRTKN